MMVFRRSNVVSVLLFVTLLIGMSYAGSLSVSLNVQKPAMDAGQNTTINASITGGTGNYICSWSYLNLFSPSKAGTFGSNSCNTTFYGNASDLGNPEQINVNVNDNASNTGSASTYVGVDTKLTLNLNASANTIYADNSIQITNNTVNGSVEYSGSGNYASYSYVVPANVIQEGNSFLFNYPGIYTITEKVVDTNNEAAYASINITVLPSAIPTAPPLSANIIPLKATIDQTQSQNIIVNATGGSGNDVYSFFVNNVLTQATASNVLVFTPNTQGTYDIYAEVTDSANDVANTVNSVVTVNPLPSITLSPSTANIMLNQQIKISNISTAGTLPYTYSYTNTPGLTRNGNNFSAAVPGTYNIKETITDSLGEQASANATITVLAPTITVQILPISATIDLGQNVVFSSAVTGGYGAYTYNWIANNLQVGSENTLLLEPNTSGTYNVYLTVTDSNGDTGRSINSTVTVNPALSIAITASSNTVYVGNSIEISNVTSGGTSPYVYSYTVTPNALENGNNFTFQNKGSYLITETVMDSKGSLAKANASIIVNAIPTTLSASITPSNSTIHKKQEITLTANVLTNAANNSYMYEWYVKTPKSSNYSLIANATLKNYTFDTFPQTTLGTYYFIVNVDDVTSNMIVNSSVAMVNVITPASCHNPHYNTSNCDNDNQKSCKGNDDNDNYNGGWNTWNVNSQGNKNTWNWNGQGSWNNNGNENQEENCNNQYNYTGYNNTRTHYNVSKDNCYELYVNFGDNYSNYNNSYQNYSYNNNQDNWFNVNTNSQNNYSQGVYSNNNNKNSNNKDNQNYENNWFG